MIDASTAGSLERCRAHLEAMAERQRGVHPHYFGVTMLNLAIIAICSGSSRRSALVRPTKRSKP